MGKPCKVAGDCPGSRCNSLDDPFCIAAEPGPPTGSGDTACLERRLTCFGGTTPGKACTANIDCSGGGTCGSDCNQTAMHLNLCNSPRILTLSGSGPTGSALLVTTTAIGTIATPDDSGACTKAGVCAPFAFGTTPAACTVNSECSGGTTCHSAVCGGICSGGFNNGKGCLVATDCPSGSCVQGGNFGVSCVGGIPNECGATNICRAVNVPKGFDGIPCTDDDSIPARGLPNTIPTTTGVATAGIIDANNIAGQLIDDGWCTGSTAACTTQRQGTLFNCTQVQMGNLSGGQLSAAFTQIDANIILDSIVTTGFTAE
jgi:hypothetical protein